MLPEDGRRCADEFAAAVARAQPRFVGVLSDICEVCTTRGVEGVLDRAVTVAAQLLEAEKREGAEQPTFAQVFAACGVDEELSVRPRPIAQL